MHNKEGRNVYQEHVIGDYAKKFDNLRGYINEKIDEENFSAGPVYTVKTSKGQELSFYTFTIAGSQTGSPRKDLLIMMGIDKSGELISQRIDFLDYIDNEIMAKGDIVTKTRGGGVATATELMHLHLLQELATKEQRPIRYGVNDINGEELRRLKTTVDIEKRFLYKRKLAEHERWEQLYGKNGLLGFNDALTKIFVPGRKGEGTTSSAISLERSIKYREGRELLIPIAIERSELQSAEKKHEFQQKQRAWLEYQLSPQLAQAA